MTETPSRQPKGQPTGGQFSGKSNPEANTELVDTSFDGPYTTIIDSKTIGPWDYSIGFGTDDAGGRHYHVRNEKYESGWRFEIAKNGQTAVAEPFGPRWQDAEWRDKGDADIREIVNTLEPDIRFVELRGDTYVIRGPAHPVDPETYEKRPSHMVTNGQGGSRVWLANDDLNVIHRESGPAFIHSDGTREWVENDEMVSPPLGTELTPDEARAVVSYTEVNATFDATGDREFTLMARDMPRSKRLPGDARIPRRFTNLSTGFEIFIGGTNGMNTESATVNMTSCRVSGRSRSR